MGIGPYVIKLVDTANWKRIIGKLETSSLVLRRLASTTSLPHGNTPHRCPNTQSWSLVSLSRNRQLLQICLLAEQSMHNPQQATISHVSSTRTTTPINPFYPMRNHSSETLPTVQAHVSPNPQKQAFRTRGRISSRQRPCWQLQYRHVLT